MHPFDGFFTRVDVSKTLFKELYWTDQQTTKYYLHFSPFPGWRTKNIKRTGLMSLEEFMQKTKQPTNDKERKNVVVYLCFTL